MITTSSSLTHPSPILVTFFLFILVRALSIYLLRKFQVYNTMLLSINTILYVRAPELIHLLTENLYPLTNTSPFSPAPSLCQHCPLTKKAFFLSSLLRDFLSRPDFPASRGNLEAWATPDPASSKAASDRNWEAAVPLHRHMISITQPHPASSPARPSASSSELVVPAPATHIPLAGLDHRLLITKASSSQLCPCHRALAGNPPSVLRR